MSGAAAEHVGAYYDLLEAQLIKAKNSPPDTRIPAVRIALRDLDAPHRGRLALLDRVELLVLDFALDAT